MLLPNRKSSTNGWHLNHGLQRQLPGSEWDYTFSEQNGKTTVRITIYNESLARMERMIEMGFKQGYTESMTNLDNLLATLSGK